MSHTLTRRAFLAASALATLAACNSADVNDDTVGSAGAAESSSGSATGSEATSDGTDAAEATATENTETTDDSGVITSVDADDPYGTGVHHVTIEVADYGTIEATLSAVAAPITTSNFCHLAADGFYDGLTFHRVIEGFMIQGGDPNGDGTGGSGTNIKGEFSENGVDNPMTHQRGTVSMARSSGYDSASSQFFIMQEASSSLDGQYAAFGTVSSGMDVVDAICENVPVQDDNGTVAAADQPVITAIRVVD